MPDRFSHTVSRCALALFPLAALQVPLIGQAAAAEQSSPSKIAPSVVQQVAPRKSIPAAAPGSSITTRIPDVAVSQDILDIRQYEKVKITSLDVPWPPADCKRTTWHAQISNGNPNTVSQLQLKGWQFLENQQQWYAIGSSEVFSIEGNQTKVLEGNWTPGPYTTKYKMVLHFKGKILNKYEERTKDLVIPATANLDILQPEFIGDSWKVTLKNNTAIPECAITVHTYLAKTSSGARVPAGGLGVQVPANGSGSTQNNISLPNWRTNYDEFQVYIRRAPTWAPLVGPGWTEIKSQSFPLP